MEQLSPYAIIADLTSMHCTQIILCELGDSAQVFVGIRSAFRMILMRCQSCFSRQTFMH